MSKIPPLRTISSSTPSDAVVPEKKRGLNPRKNIRTENTSSEDGSLGNSSLPESASINTRLATKSTNSSAPSLSQSISQSSFLISRDDLENLTATVLLQIQDFQTGLFLSGQGETQKQQVNALSKLLFNQYCHGSSQNLRSLLDEIKTLDQKEPRNPVRNSFFLRSAILQASENNGLGLESWEVFTHPLPVGIDKASPGFWPWAENSKNWIPEAQAAANKYMETAWIKARELAKHNPEQQVIAYKGGFGAGKTSHGAEQYHSLIEGAIAADRAKRLVRKAHTVSHATAHLQSSDVAYKLFNALIKIPMGTVIYDSSLSAAADVDELIKKASAAGKPLKVIDITRDDKARALAVLARAIDGEDPRMPLSFIESGAERDREERPACMNLILNSSKITKNNEKSDNAVNLSHTYEFHCGDAQGANRQLLFTLKSGTPPEWNTDLENDEITRRLESQGIKYNVTTKQFETLQSREKWSDLLHEELKKPVKMLVDDLSESEAKIRRKCFGSRYFPLERIPDYMTPANLYAALSENICKAISEKAFIDSFEGLSFEETQKVIETFKEIHNKGKSVSYMELPAFLALELNKAFREIPECWTYDTSQP